MTAIREPLVRRPEERILLGVCAAVGNHLGISPWYVRAFVLVVPMLIPIYLFLAVAVPSAQQGAVVQSRLARIQTSISGTWLRTLEIPLLILGLALGVAIVGATYYDPRSGILSAFLLLDVHLPGGHGGGGAEVVRRADTGARFLALSVSDAAQDVVSVIRAGARGYVTKSITTEELIDAIRRVASGDAAFSARLAGFVLDAFNAPGQEIAVGEDELDRLTEREVEVMRLIARGRTYREVASELFISIKTVETHVSAVLRKLQLSNRRELARWAAARRLI